MDQDGKSEVRLMLKRPAWPYTNVDEDRYSYHDLDRSSDPDEVQCAALLIRVLDVALAGFSYRFFLKEQNQRQKQLHLYMGVPINLLGDDPRSHKGHWESDQLGENLDRDKLRENFANVELSHTARNQK